MKRFFTILSMLSLFGWSNVILKAQTTLTFQPDATTGKDAYLQSLNPDINYGTHPDFNSEACKNGGNFVAVRSVIDFDLSSIPSTAVITNAKLYLYTYNSPNTGQHTGDNISLLQRITSSWNANSVTWNTAPTTTTLHQATLSASTDVNENYIVDVTNLVQDYVADNSNSFGFMLRLADETVFKKMVFGSSNNADSTLHPKLVITYTQTIPSDSCLTLQPDGTKGKDAYLRSLTPDINYGTHPDFNAEACTNGGNFVAVRSVIDFDLSSIPSTAFISNAKLYLYTYNSPNTGQHTGDNLSLLQRRTSSWNDMTVTWNTAPTTTTLHQDTLPTFTDINENYIVDITTLIQDYVADKANSFGFMLRLADETIQKKMIFASSNNADLTLHPKLVVCYSTANGVPEQQLTNNYVSVYPNPAKDNIIIETNSNTQQRVEILNLMGQYVYKSSINKNVTINTSAFANGVYILKLSTDKEMLVRKFVKQ